MFQRTAEQQLFEETTQRFLEAECPLTAVRALVDTPAGYDAAYWRHGAELGWTSLVVPEASGGGTISSERGVVDLALVAYQFGLHAAPGPLMGTNVVAAALGRWGNDKQQSGPLPALLAGEATGAWAADLDITPEGDGFRVSGRSAPVEAGTDADYLLVTGTGGAALVGTDTPGVSITPRHGLDTTRRFATVTFDGVVVDGDAVLGAMPDVTWLTDVALIVQVAEMCGAMRWAFDTTVEWAMNRYSFGRPLASYQELKHRFADMKMWLEASDAITARAAAAVDADTAEQSELVSAAKFFVGRYGVELMHDCVQIHGGIGLTSDHDLHLFLRRVLTNAATLGTPAEHAIRLAGVVEARTR